MASFLWYNDPSKLIHFGNESDYWNDRKPSKIEAFLRAYFDDPTLILTRVEEQCNQATGYPVWYFESFSTKK